MTPCFGYVRVSTQRQGEGVSLDAQKDDILRYAVRRNLEVIEWFEETVTARKAGRPEYNRMVAQLKRGKARGLIVHKVDRSARNYTDWDKVHQLADCGIEIHVANENLDFTTRGGRLSADIQAVFAADYSRNLSDEVRKGQRKQIDLGLYPYRTPLGYLSNGRATLRTPDPAYAPFIKLAFKLYGTGNYSLRSLQREMERRGFRSKKGRVVSRSSLENILDNPFYCGTVRLKRSGITYKGKHQKLVSATLFKKVQAIKAGKSGKKNTKHNHTFRGLFRCIHCNGLLTGEWQKQKVYYRCHESGCPSKTIRESVIDQTFLQFLRANQLSPEEAAWLTTEVQEFARSHENCAEVRALKLQIEQTTVRLDRLTNAMLDNLVSKEEYQSRRETLLMEQERLREARRKFTKNGLSDDMIAKFFERINNVAESYENAKPHTKREIIVSLTSNRSLDRKKLAIEPQNWVRETKKIASGLNCGDDRANFRTLFNVIRTSGANHDAVKRQNSQTD